MMQELAKLSRRFKEIEVDEEFGAEGTEGQHDEVLFDWFRRTFLDDPRALGALFVESAIIKAGAILVFEQRGKTGKVLEMIENGLGIFADLRVHLFPNMDRVKAAIPDAAERWPLVFAAANVEKREKSK